VKTHPQIVYFVQRIEFLHRLVFVLKDSLLILSKIVNLAALNASHVPSHLIIVWFAQIHFSKIHPHANVTLINIFHFPSENVCFVKFNVINVLFYRIYVSTVKEKIETLLIVFALEAIFLQVLTYQLIVS
jgi:hypothetical protein